MAGEQRGDQRRAPVALAHVVGLPLSGALATVPGAALGAGWVTFPASTSGYLAQVVPPSTVITSMSLRFTPSYLITLAATSVIVTAQVYVASTTTRYYPLAGATVHLNQSLSGAVAATAPYFGDKTAMNVSIPSGERAVVVVSGTATGLDTMPHLTGVVSVAISGS